MTNGTEKRGPLAIWLGVAVVVVIGVVLALTRPWAGAWHGPARERAPEPEASRGDSRTPGPRPLAEGQDRTPSAPVGTYGTVAGRPTRLASGPLRFVARYGDGRPRRPGGPPRTAEEARALVESVRSRVVRGEDPFALIRELSDPPSGIAAEVVERHRDLEPGQASPIEPIDGGFALFFGNPGRLPADAGVSSTP